MHLSFRKFLATSIFMAIVRAHAGTLNVPLQYTNIQTAINAAAVGDVVLVAPGTYLENIDFRGKAIEVVSEAGPGATILDGNNAGAVVVFDSGETRNSVLSGFTIRNGSSPYGSGITLLGASATIVSNIFETNNIVIGYYGAAIGGNGASPAIEKNIFRYNSTDDQFLAGVVSFVNSSSPWIANNVFYNNPGRAINLTLPEGNSPVVVNNTIVGNRLGVRVDGRVNASALSFFNNLIVGNGVGLLVDFGSPPTWEYNLVGGNQANYQGITDQTGVNGNISGVPSFFDPASNDYRLLPGSLGIDAGDNSAPQLPAEDFFGSPRIVAGQIGGPAIVDMGAYEFDADFKRPSVVTLAATGTNTEGMLNGTVNPNGILATGWFEWGTTPVRSFITTPVNFGDGGASLQLQTPLSGLKPGVAYHYRTVATNAIGISIGLDGIFQTPMVTLIGSGTVTNWYHTDFVDPGAYATASPLAIAAGGAHSLALKADGTIAGWGFNADGETSIPADATNVVAIAAGEGHSVALKADGSVMAWGGGSSGRTNVPASATNVVAITAGEMHSLALKSDGSVVGWGWSFYGQTNVPPEASNIVGIAAGIYRSMALKSDGTILTWGRDVFGENQVPPNATNILAIASGWYHSVALRADGTVLAWGAGTSNTGSFPDYGQAMVPSDATNIIAISANYAHTLALRADGSVLAWGLNSNGQTNVPPNLTNAVAIAAGYYHSLAFLADGTVVGWGRNDNEQTTIPSDLTISNLPVAVNGTVNSDVPNMYTLTYTSTNRFGGVGTATRTVVVPGAMSIKSDVFGQMANFATNGTTQMPQFTRATNDLARSLLASLWTDETHLDTGHGRAVFIAEAQTVQSLKRLMNKKQHSISDSVLQDWMARLVSADQLLANVEIQAAATVNPNDRRLAAALKEFNAGVAAANMQQYVAAILDFGTAWTRAANVVEGPSQGR